LFSAEPLDVVGLTSGAIALDVGSMHACAVLEGGGVRCWGYNSNGQLGDGTTATRSVPVDVVGLMEEQRVVTAGDSHSCVTSVTGVASCWGNNSHGRLGNGTDTASTTPVQVSGPSRDYRSITAASQHTCARSASDEVWCWGANWSGQLGDGTTVDRSLPGDAPILDDTSVVTAGRSHTCAVAVTGGVSCWGRNHGGQLANGSRDSRSVPTPVNGLDLPGLDVAAGDAHTCIVTTEGTVMCAGRNLCGQLGDGTRLNHRLTLVPVASP
jgi:alpha-tubulin suppressor-like RCC1 family protein